MNIKITEDKEDASRTFYRLFVNGHPVLGDYRRDYVLHVYQFLQQLQDCGHEFQIIETTLNTPHKETRLTINATLRINSSL